MHASHQTESSSKCSEGSTNMVLRHVSFRCYVPGVTRIIANTKKQYVKNLNHRHSKGTFFLEKVFRFLGFLGFFSIAIVMVCCSRKSRWCTLQVTSSKDRNVRDLVTALFGADGLTKSCSDTIVFDDAASRIEAKLTALPASLQQYVKVKVYTVHSPLYVVF